MLLSEGSYCVCVVVGINQIILDSAVVDITYSRGHVNIHSPSGTHSSLLNSVFSFIGLVQHRVLLTDSAPWNQS